MRAVRVLLIGADFLDDRCECYLIPTILGDILVADDLDNFSSLEALVFGSFRSVTYALAQVFQFVGIQLVPCVLVFRLVSQLAMF